MEVMTDEKEGLYLENLEEYIYDDEKIVRPPWFFNPIYLLRMITL